MAPFRVETDNMDNGSTYTHDMFQREEYSLMTKTATWQIELEEMLKPGLELGPYRQIGDRLSWIITLDTINVEPSPECRDNLFDKSSFALRPSMEHSPLTYLQVGFGAMQSCVFRHTYFTS